MIGKYLKYLMFFGGLLIMMMVVSQSYWLMKTWDIKDQEFDQTIQISLREVANKISEYNKTEIPKTNLIQRRSSNIYAVNVNSAIDANILEDELIQQLEKNAISTDFEYAVFDCYSDNLVYGNYCQLEEGDEISPRPEDLPKFNDLVYYFVVKFPSREGYLIRNLSNSILSSILMVLAVLFFLYLISVILKQQKVSDLQKDFINNMTHEFKTPISSIKIATEVLSSSPEIKSNDRLDRYSKIIHSQNQRLNNQVEKVLNIAKIENDSFKLNLEKIAPIDVITEIVNHEALKLQNGTITVYPINNPIFIKADLLHFTNVITNIIDNALKYCKDDVPAHLKIEFIEKAGLIISFIDNGIGISKENLKKVYDKFYRVNTGNVHNVKGFGLGLFYVRNICKEHGWDIDLLSSEGQGTIVKISIPKEKIYYE